MKSAARKKRGGGGGGTLEGVDMFSHSTLVAFGCQPHMALYDIKGKELQTALRINNLSPLFRSAHPTFWGGGDLGEKIWWGGRQIKNPGCLFIQMAKWSHWRLAGVAQSLGTLTLACLYHLYHPVNSCCFFSVSPQCSVPLC